MILTKTAEIPLQSYDVIDCAVPLDFEKMDVERDDRNNS